MRITDKTSAAIIEEFGLNTDGIDYLLHKGCKVEVTPSTGGDVYSYDRLTVEIPKDLPLDRIILYTATVFSDCLKEDVVLRDILTGVGTDYVGISGEIYDSRDYLNT